MKKNPAHHESLWGLSPMLLLASFVLPISALADETGTLSEEKIREEDPKETLELEPMIVTDAALEQPVYQMETSTAGTKFPIEITKVPQSIQVITEDAFKDQGAQSIGDIMKQVPSANVRGSRFTGGFPSVSIRGFKAEQTRNGIRQLFFSDVDFSSLSHIQSVEVLKGPGGALFGQASASEGATGGVINVSTKRPYDQLGSEVSFTRGGWTGFDGDITSGRWDFNVPMGAFKARFTGEVESSDTFTQFQELDRQNFGLMLTYDDGGPVRAFINAEYQRVENLPSPALPAVGTVVNSGVGRISRDTFLGEPRFDEATTQSPLVQAWMEIDLLDNWNDILSDWKITPRYQYHEFRVRTDQTLSSNDSAAVDPVTGAIVVSRAGRFNFHETDKVHIGQIDITGKLNTGPLKHQIYLNGDFQKTNSPNSQNFWFDRINVPDINALNPTFLNTAPEIDSDRISFGSEATLWSGGFQDVISITKYFDLLGGFRYTSIDSETNVTNSTFQIGGTVHATDSIHFFAGFGEGFGFQPGAITVTGQPFDAEESEQVEAGIKVNFPWGLSGTASFFELTRTNVGTPDPQTPGFSVQTGEIRHRGAEVELAYQVTDQWYVQGGYAFIDSKITKSNDGDQGNRFLNTPEHQANIWTHYRFDSGALRNLTISTGVNFVGDRPLDNTNTVKLPNYTTWDLGASYTFDKVKPFKDVKLELFANNILDKNYFTTADRFSGSAVAPGDPRSIVGRISLKY